jgi:hypothetical protein
MIFAQILNGIIKNAIVLEDLSLSHLFSENFDYFIDVTDMTPRPGISWTYDSESETFTPPPQE